MISERIVVDALTVLSGSLLRVERIEMVLRAPL